MKATLLHGGGDLRYETVPDPAPGPHEVVVKVHACSICGSDLHAFHGKHPRLTFPRILGHEFAGEIVAAGKGVRNFLAGQRAQLPPLSLGFVSLIGFAPRSANALATALPRLPAAPVTMTVRLCASTVLLRITAGTA